MSTLWIAIANADDKDRSHAVDALHDAGLEVSRAWIDSRPTYTADEEQEHVEMTREPLGAVFFGGVATLFALASGWLLSLGGWWVAAALPCGIFMLLGIIGSIACAQLQEKEPKTP